MKQLLRCLFSVFCVIVMVLTARSQEHGTPAEAKQMVEDALAHIKQVGAAQAFEDFSGSPKWYKKDIYLFCYSMDGTCTCQGANKAMLGKNLIDYKSADGQPFIKNILELAKKGGGWIEYQWPHPQTGKLQAKRAYIAKIPGYDGLVGAGAYK